LGSIIHPGLTIQSHCGLTLLEKIVLQHMCE
jgi:hypothetical protein